MSRSANTTDQRVSIALFGESEDNSATVKVKVSGKYNLTMFDRTVLGIDPNDLEPCDLPQPDELTGTVLTVEADIERWIDASRPVVLAARNKRR